MIRCPFCAQNIVATLHTNDSSGYPESKTTLMTNTDGQLMIQSGYSWEICAETILEQPKKQNNPENSILCIRCGFEAPAHCWRECYLRPYDFGFEDNLCRCGGELFLEPVGHRFNNYGLVCDTCGFSVKQRETND